MKHQMMIISLALAAAACFGCSDDSITNTDEKGPAEDTCGGKVCKSSETCYKNECRPNADKCGSTWCGDGEICRDRTCGQKGESCGDTTCFKGESCIDNQCVKPDILCGDKTCGSDETCIQDECIKTDNLCGDDICEMGEKCVNNQCMQMTEICGQNLCLETQKCIYGECRDAGDCGGWSCKDEETCIEGVCRLPGDCNGIQCDERESCIDEVCTGPIECGSATCLATEYCDINLTCIPRAECGNKLCDNDDICEDGECKPNPTCQTGEPRCSGVCCDEGQFCGTRQTCCAYQNSCGRDCCRDGEACVNEICRKDCGSKLRCASADGTDLCCEEGEICTSNQCFKPTTSCIDTYMCDNGQYCDSVTHTCLPNPKGEVCKMEPKGGEVIPKKILHWGEGSKIPAFKNDYVKVMSTIMVADVNEDGKPEMVFNSWRRGGAYQGGGILRIVNGQDGTTLASSNLEPQTDGGSQTALGKLYPKDKYPDQKANNIDVTGLQIVTCIVEEGRYKIAAYNKNAQLIWKSSNTYQGTSGFNECGQSGPGIADFNGDGLPEVYSRYNVYNGQTGEIIGRVACGDAQAAHAPCDYPVAVDLNGDDRLELVGGNVAYNVDFDNKKLVPVYQLPNDVHPDGYPGVADIDLDGNPEIFVVRQNSTVMAFKHDGSNYWSAPVKHDAEGGGPPTIANINDTPQLELTFAGKWGYIAFDYQGKILWKRTTWDQSSARTGSSVFDFDGDGKAEIVYADECYLRVYNGADGTTQFCAFNPSATHWEYPTIVDVNLDGHAEIIVGANEYGQACHAVDAAKGLDDCVQHLITENNNQPFAQLNGVRVFAAPNRDWVDTRKIYNQHAYSITNVSDDGTIPKKQRANWKTQGLNNFRLNNQPGATYLPNLKIQSVSSPYDCPATVPIYFNVVNDGWAVAPSGVGVSIYYSTTSDYADPVLYTTVKTTKNLGVGQDESFKVDFTFPEGVHAPVYFTIQFGDGSPEMCRKDDKVQRYVKECPVN